MNNITRVCLRRSRSSGQRPTHLSASLPEYTAKQVPCQPDSYSKHEPNVRTSLPDTRMMVSLTQLRAHFAVPVPISLSASPSRLKNEKLEDDLHLFGEPYPQNYKKIFPERDAKDFLMAGPASASSRSVSARSWNKLGHSDGSTATGSLGSHGPGSSDDSRNTRRRLDTFSSAENEHARSAV